MADTIFTPLPITGGFTQIMLAFLDLNTPVVQQTSAYFLQRLEEGGKPAVFDGDIASIFASAGSPFVMEYGVALFAKPTFDTLLDFVALAHIESESSDAPAVSSFEEHASIEFKHDGVPNFMYEDGTLIYVPAVRIYNPDASEAPGISITPFVQINLKGRK